MFCPSCGKPADAGVSFCSSCGAALSSVPPPLPAAPPPRPLPPSGASPFGDFRLPPPPPSQPSSEAGPGDVDPRLGQFGPAVDAIIAMFKLDRSTIRRVAFTDEATRMAIILVAIAGAASGVGSLNPVAIIFGPIFALIGVAIAVGIAHLVATTVGGQGNYLSLFRCQGFLSGAGIVGAVPFIGWLAVFALNIWSLFVLVPVFEETYRMPRDKAILSVAILIGIYLAFCIVLVAAIFFGIMGIFALAK